MQKKIIISLFLVLLSIPMAAQVKIGFFSYDDALRSMPEYTTVQEELATLRKQYDAEAKRSEDDFSTKYEEFLDSYSTLATSIRRKRQNELQQMMDTNVKFRTEAERLLRQAEDDAMQNLRQRLDACVQRVAQKHGFTFMLNTDSNACPYIDPAYGENANTLIQQAVKEK